jgi:hypothetical protein
MMQQKTLARFFRTGLATISFAKIFTCLHRRFEIGDGGGLGELGRLAVEKYRSEPIMGLCWRRKKAEQLSPAFPKTNARKLFLTEHLATQNLQAD